MAGCSAIGDEIIDDGWDVALALARGAVLLEEADEVRLKLIEEADRESPEVHRNDGVLCDETSLAIEGAAFDFVVIFAGDIDDFFDSSEKVFGRLSNTAIDGTVVGKGVGDLVTDETVMLLVVVDGITG